MLPEDRDAAYLWDMLEVCVPSEIGKLADLQRWLKFALILSRKISK